MYAIQGNSVVSIEVKDVVSVGAVLDNKISKMERVVAGYYEVKETSLDAVLDTDAKIMCCFMLHDLLSYSVRSLANRYKINRLYLRKNITDIYIKCLQAEADMQRVIALQSAFFVEIKKN